MAIISSDIGDNLPWISYPDIGNLARWSVSSWKYGFGLDCLRDDNPETFWQYAAIPLSCEIIDWGYSSEGNQPHSITLEFPKRVAMQVRI